MASHVDLTVLSIYLKPEAFDHNLNIYTYHFSLFSEKLFCRHIHFEWKSTKIRRFNQISVLNYSKYKINNTFLTVKVTVKWYSKKEPNRSVKSEFVLNTLRSKKCQEIMHKLSRPGLNLLALYFILRTYLFCSAIYENLKTIAQMFLVLIQEE